MGIVLQAVAWLLTLAVQEDPPHQEIQKIEDTAAHPELSPHGSDRMYRTVCKELGCGDLQG